MTIRARLMRIGVLAVLVFVTGCAQQPTVGQWFGPLQPGPLTIQDVRLPDGTAKLVKTPHYEIYSTMNDDQFLTKIGQLMEGSLTAYQTLAPDVPATDRPMECYMFAKRVQWAEFTRERTGQDVNIYLQINRGAYTLHDFYVAYYIGPVSTCSVAAHEGWHQFVFRHFKGRLPPFLEEGLATMFESVRFEENGLPQFNLSMNQTRAISLRRAMDNGSLWALDEVVGMNAGQVVGKPGEKVDAFYAQAWALARFLWDADNAKYRPVLRQILADTASGTVFDPYHTLHGQFVRLRPLNPEGVKAMLEHYMGMPFDQIEDKYNHYIRYLAYDELPEQSADEG
jgi:Protein of unknown function (DUF1570)